MSRCMKAVWSCGESRGSEALVIQSLVHCHRRPRCSLAAPINDMSRCHRRSCHCCSLSHRPSFIRTSSPFSRALCVSLPSLCAYVFDATERREHRREGDKLRMCRVCTPFALAGSPKNGLPDDGTSLSVVCSRSCLPRLFSSLSLLSPSTLHCILLALTSHSHAWDQVCHSLFFPSMLFLSNLVAWSSSFLSPADFNARLGQT